MALLFALFLPWAHVWIRNLTAWEAYSVFDILLLALAMGGIYLALSHRAGQAGAAPAVTVAAGSAVAALVVAIRIVSPVGAGFEDEFRLTPGGGAGLGLVAVLAIGLGATLSAREVGLTLATAKRRWLTLPPDKRRLLALAGGLATLITVAALVEERTPSENPYLPVTDGSVIQLIRDENPDQDLSGSDWIIEQRTDLGDIPDSDLSGEPTDDDPSHWYRATYRDESDGTCYEWDANPYSQDVYQEGLSVGC